MPYINRPPRIQPELPGGEVKTPTPPQATGQARSWLGLLMPIFMSLAYTLMFLSRGAAALGYMLPMMLVMLAASGIGYINWREGRQAEAQKQENYRATLNHLRDRLVKAHDTQRHFYEYTRPPAATILPFVADGAVRDVRLWERRPADADFATLRMGWGSLPSTVQVEPPHADTDAPLMPLAARVAEEFATVSDIAISLNLRRTHAVGIASPHHQWSAEFVNAMLVHFAGLHAPDEAQLFIVGAPHVATHWQWARWLPHSNSNTSQSEQGSGDHLCFEEVAIKQLWDFLQVELERRQARASERSTNDAPPALPFLLVIIDSYTAGGKSPLEEVEAEAAVSLLLRHGARLGAAVIFLTEDTQHIPGECQAVVEAGVDAQQQISFRYKEIGVNSPLHDGIADRLDQGRAEHFARMLAPFVLRTTHGADLPKSITLLEALDLPPNQPKAVDAFVQECWRRSLGPGAAQVEQWPHTLLGMGPNQKALELILTSREAGVHGLIAGTTGSGKSELLQSMILSLAMQHDPRLVHFVLIDFKGGTAFEVLRPLPHTVSITTNLQGQLGVRTFVALKTELARRQEILKDYQPGDIATYYKTRRPGTPPLPHLFVIIDEFAEMIKEMPDFRTDLNSIAALGRALGVHLILATQNPEGVVSDQIRANMKFHICLRVEAASHSRDLIGRTDAAFLPPNIPGRAYFQIGSGKIDLFQVAHSGAPYHEMQPLQARPVVRFPNREAARQLAGTDEPDTMAKALIQQMRLAAQETEIPEQEKPWPDPLPEKLYLSELVSAVHAWENGTGKWKPLQWDKEAVRPFIGLLDNPASMRDKQPDFVVDLTRGHVVIFGAGGWGKTYFLRTLITNLAATHSPADVHFYLLDFGNLGLEVFQEMPHVGDIIHAAEDERIRRLLRKLDGELGMRRRTLNQERADNLCTYNQRAAADRRLPAICLILDNLAEFRENFPDEMETLTALARESRAAGIHMVFTADRPGTMPSKMFSQFTERLALRLADTSQYPDVLGRFVPEPAEIPGRGFVRRGRTPLEFQIALPVGRPEELAEGRESTVSEEDQTSRLENMIAHMQAAWHDHPGTPEHIEELQNFYALPYVLEKADGTVFSPNGGVTATLGIDDATLQPVGVNLREYGQHFAVLGGPVSGKTTILGTWILSIAAHRAPQEVMLVLVDARGRLVRYGGVDCVPLSELPHVVHTADPYDSLEVIHKKLEKEFAWRTESRKSDPRIIFPEIFVVIDDYDLLPSPSSTASTGLLRSEPPSAKLANLARRHGEELHFVISHTLNKPTFIPSDPLLRVLSGANYGMAMGSVEMPNALGARVLRGSVSELPPGRGFLVRSGREQLIQIAAVDRERPDEFNMWMHDLIARCGDAHATWTYPDLELEESTEEQETQP